MKKKRLKEQGLSFVKFYPKKTFSIFSIFVVLFLIAGFIYPGFLKTRGAPISVTNTFGGGIDGSNEGIVNALGNPTWNKYLDSEALELNPDSNQLQLAETVSEWEGVGHNISGSNTIIDENPVIYPDSVPGNYFVVWESDGNNLKVQKLDGDGNALWTNAASVVSGTYYLEPEAYNNEFDAVSDGNGGIVIVWADSRNIGTSDVDIYIKHLDENGLPTGFGEASVIDSGGNQLRPRVISSGGSRAIVSWFDMQTNRAFMQRIDNGGLSWGWVDDFQERFPGYYIGIPIVDKFTGIDTIPMISDGSGGAIIVWMDNNHLNSVRDPQDINSPQDVYDIYVLRIDSNGNLHLGWDVRGIKVSSQPAGTVNQTFPRIIIDGTGGVIVFWKSVDKLFAQKINPDNCIGDNGRCWDANGIEVSDHNPLASYADPLNNFKVVSDGSGGTVVVWQENGVGTGIDIYAQRVNNIGSTVWDTGGLPIAVTVGDQERSTINRDVSTGEFHIVWSDERSGSAQIFTQKVLANGAIGYKDGVSGEDEINGIKLNFDKQLSESNPFVFYNNDGLGGEIILAYADDPSIPPYDVYIQKIGAKNFFLDGVIISSIYDFGQTVNWAPFEMVADTPDSSQIYFETRTANDEPTLNNWSDDDWSTPVDIDLGDLRIPSPAGRYIQYRLTFERGSTPILSSITLSGSLPSSTPPTYTILNPEQGTEETSNEVATPKEETAEKVPQVCSDSLAETQATPIPPLNPIWGKNYHPWDDSVKWAYDHRANIYHEYISLLKREPCAIEVNWWLQNNPDINSIRYEILTSEEYRSKNK